MCAMAARDVPRKNQLEWFLEFLNLDLDRIGVGEKAKWAVEISGLLGGQVHLDEEDAKPPSVRQEIADYLGERALSKIDLKRYQEELRNFFRFMMKEIESWSTHLIRDWMPIEELDLIPSFNRFSIQELSVDLGGSVNFWETKTETTSDGKKRYFFNCSQWAIDEMTMRVSFRTPASADALKFHFALVLEGTPLGAFRKCQECKKMFLHLSRREKTFCSNLCASRYGTRKRREKIKNEDPAAYEAELKGNAERAHRRYVQKLKSTGKPARRPYKHRVE